MASFEASRVGRAARLLLVAALGGLAVIVAVTGAFLHRWASPAGLALALGAVFGISVFARYAARTRWGIAWVGLAWLAPILVLAQPRSAGDVVIAGDAAGLTLLFGGAMAVSVALGMGAGRPQGDKVVRIEENNSTYVE
ncbi:DUF6113 family protein [Phytoactinopolyspora mesophila]|uniref:Uncharacterized protein n=1 Tax=Phytoactinopolyspora mesophila TaxID=2650750 RepID=A0A7K3M913_9ACTN|nr:hypothetical protein [Phytoactinopolyspora mesophila]